jgi:putative endonuclease
MHFVYIIQSENDRSYYIGETGDITKRLDYHNKGLQRYTKRRCPWKLVYSEILVGRTEALKRERELKNKKSRKHIEWLIANQAG